MKIVTLIGWWLAVFFCTYVALSVIHMIPDEFADWNSRIFTFFTKEASVSTAVEISSANTAKNNIKQDILLESVLPDRIVIEKIGVNAPVVNPETRDIVALDQALLQGVVRYPGSGGLDDISNMFLFGHSTNWATVHNQAYKSLNRLGELQIGDIIRVESNKTIYIYKVFSVSQVDKDKALVEFKTGEKLLTLSTCDTFGARSNRFVVEARFMQALPKDKDKVR